MKERPILFSAPMVQAILEGRKTQTRRIVKDIPENVSLHTYYGAYTDGRLGSAPRSALAHSLGWFVPVAGDLWPCNDKDRIRCPYGQPGDRLWVRETWWHPEPYSYGTLPSGEELNAPRFVSQYAPVLYAADGNPPNTPNRHYPDGLRSGFSAPDPYAIWSKRPPIFIPRWASRILLEITDIRVERLQDISEPDAIAEGVLISDEWTGCADDLDGSYVKAYRFLWESINGAGSWDKNPWVWVIVFKEIK